MNKPMDSWARRLLVVLLVIVLGSIFAAASSSTVVFGTFNDDWDGTSSLRETATESGATIKIGIGPNGRIKKPPSETVVMLLSPTESYEDSTLSSLRAFVQNGGTLVVAEDFGSSGNQILAGVGAQTRFNGTVVRDPHYNGDTTAMPVVTNIQSHPRTRGVDELVLNYGTVIDINTRTQNDVTVVASTSKFSYLDRDDDGENSKNETLQSYPVISVEPIGEGQVVAVSDPSVFINVMQTRGSNDAFSTALVGDHNFVVLDYSRSSVQPVAQQIRLWLQQTPAALAAAGGLVTLVVLLVARYIRRDKKTT